MLESYVLYGLPIIVLAIGAGAFAFQRIARRRRSTPQE